MTEATADLDELATFYRHLADAEFDGYCEPYARIARALAADDEALRLVATLPAATKVIPVLLFAAVQYLVIGEPDLELARSYRGDSGDPWPPFRRFVLDRFDELRTLVATRSIQTNEVGRATLLLPALITVHGRADRPLALVELGASAGLNLGLDRFGYDYVAHYVGARSSGSMSWSLGDPASPVQLTCEVRSNPGPPLEQPPPIAQRVGVDLHPIDVRDEDACRWLEACVWPLVPHRADRLRAAIALTRTDPPELHRGDALMQLRSIVAAIPDDVLPCIVCTWVLSYLSRDDRRALGDHLDELGAQRDLAVITAEYPGIAPWIERPDHPAAHESRTATLLGLLTWIGGERVAAPLAWAHAHGAWIDWVDPTTAGPSLPPR